MRAKGKAFVKDQQNQPPASDGTGFQDEDRDSAAVSRSKVLVSEAIAPVG